MTALLIRIFELSLSLSPFVLCMLICSKLADKRYQPKWKSGVWLAISICLIIPLRLFPQNSPINISIPNIPLPQLPRPSTPFDMGNEVVPASPNGTMLTETGERPLATPALSLYHVLAIVWIIGIVSVLLYHFFHYVTYKRTLVRWGSPDGQIQSKLEVLKATVNLKRPLTVLICKNTKGPLVIGFIKQYIVLPHANYSDAELEFILIHELTHIKKAHVWHKLIVLVATAVHWFNPLIWQMKKQSHKDLEICCDSEVATKCDNEQLIEYGNTIVHCAYDGLVNPPSLSTYFAGNKKMIKERIANLGSIKMKKKGTSLVALCLTIILCTASLVGCAIGQPQLPPPASGQQSAGQAQTNQKDSFASADTNTKPVDDTFSPALLKQQEEFAEYSKMSGALAGYHVANVARNTSKQPEGLDPHGFLVAENMSFTELLAQRKSWLDEGKVGGWIVSDTANILSSPIALVYADESLAAPYITSITPAGNPMFENQMFADGNYATFEFESGRNDIDMLWFYDMNREQIMMASTWLNQTETSVDVTFEVNSALLENLDDFIPSFTKGKSGILLSNNFDKLDKADYGNLLMLTQWRKTKGADIYVVSYHVVNKTDHSVVFNGSVSVKASAAGMEPLNSVVWDESYEQYTFSSEEITSLAKSLLDMYQIANSLL